MSGATVEESCRSRAEVAVLEFLNSVFLPGYRHLIEERRHRDTTRLTQADGDPPFALDLDAGTVTLDAAPRPDSA